MKEGHEYIFSWLFPLNPMSWQLLTIKQNALILSNFKAFFNNNYIILWMIVSKPRMIFLIVFGFDNYFITLSTLSNAIINLWTTWLI